MTANPMLWTEMSPSVLGGRAAVLRAAVLPALLMWACWCVPNRVAEPINRSVRPRGCPSRHGGGGMSAGPRRVGTGAAIKVWGGR